MSDQLRLWCWSVQWFSLTCWLFTRWPDNTEAQTCFMWANTHADKAMLVEEAVKSWKMPHSPWLPHWRMHSSLFEHGLWARQLDLLKAVTSLSRMARSRRSEVRVNLKFWPWFLLSATTLWQEKQCAVSHCVNLSAKTTVFLSFLYYTSIHKSLILIQCGRYYASNSLFNLPCLVEVFGLVKLTRCLNS